MDTIRIETMLDSDTLYLPQLLPLLGKPVEIVVRERIAPQILLGTSNWSEVESAVLSLENYDSDACLQIRSAEEPNGLGFNCS